VLQPRVAAARPNEKAAMAWPKVQDDGALGRVGQKH
jgi:hypothetical protein